jgi:hypothetical protein
MNPEEKQKILQEVSVKTQDGTTSAPLPELELTEEEQDKFSKCLGLGVPYSKEFFHPSASEFKVVLRDKTKKEGEIIGRALDRAMNKGTILNWVEYTHLFNTTSLYYQLDAINGIEHVRHYPESVYDEFNLLAELEKSVISTWTASQLYIVMGFMFQFNKAILKLSAKAFTPENFS